MSFFKKQIKKQIKDLTTSQNRVVVRDYKLSDNMIMRLVDNDDLRHRYSVSLRVVDENGQAIGKSDVENIKKELYDTLVETYDDRLVGEEIYNLKG